MVSLFAIGPKVCGFKPGRNYEFLRAINPQYVFLLTGSKAGEAISLDFIEYKKITCKYEEKYFARPNS
jgi:hypothetical protein